MSFKKAAGTGLLLLGLTSVSMAGQPPLDRPSPPPCAADGRCYSNPITCGYYATRWRRWPLEGMGQMPGGAMGPAQQQDSDIKIFERPPEGIEDQKAPPPTAPTGPREEAVRSQATGAAPAGGSSTAAPSRGAGSASGPAAGPATGPPTPPQPPGGNLFQPNDSGDPSRPRAGSLPPYEPLVPSPRSLNSTGPASDLDPPPALPFGPQPTIQSQPVREATHFPAHPVQRPAAVRNSSSSDDPPPSLPAALASVSN